jgi:diphthamide biosynthesis protein 3
MSSAVYDEVEIEDMDWRESDRTFYYPCPCGDKFSISLADLLGGEDIARCPSCSLLLRVVCDPEELDATYNGGGGAEAASAHAVEVQ